MGGTTMRTLPLADVPELAAEVAARCFAIEPVFYSLFSDDRAQNLAAIERLLLDPKTDLGRNRVLVEDGALAGFFSFYDNRRALSVQITTLKQLLRAHGVRPDTRQRVSAFNAQVPRVSGPSLYLSKIFVTGGFRGRGLARRMLAELNGIARAEGLQRISLHVRADNPAALALYRSEGYSVVDDRSQYVVLRSPDGSAPAPTREELRC